MRAVVLDPSTASFEELLERRRRSGLDRFDEVWDGVLHMVPAPSGPHSSVEWQLARLLGPLADRAGLHPGGQFNLGDDENDFRVPDGGLHRAPPLATWYPTAALVIEIVSPGDESWEKLPFYAAHEVDEVLIVDPAARSVDWLGLRDGEYRPIARSAVIELGADELADRIDWPAVAEAQS
jgi:Uma2 family endonuclease